MTTFILHGGALKRDSEKNTQFFRELVSRVSENATVLFIPFAREKSVWGEYYENAKQRIALLIPEKKICLVLASDDAKTFTRQIKDADGLLLIGGNSHILKERLDAVQDLEKLLDGKVVAGSSAGALVFARHWYENDDETYNDGFGFLPFKLFCHYTEEKADKLDRLKAFGDDSNTRTIAEEACIVFRTADAVRASVLVVKDGRSLLIHRIKNGVEYYVLPGGGVENGETLEDAARREAKEETDLDVTIDRECCRFTDGYDGREHVIFLVTRFSGTPKISGGERERASRMNQFILEWLDQERMKKVTVYPEGVKEKIRETLP